MSAELSIEEIFLKRDSFADLKVVVVDVKSYSTRSPRIQMEIVSGLTLCLEEALREATVQYKTYEPHHQEEVFEAGIIKIPTGDGAAIAFSCTGHPYVHLIFAEHLLKAIHKLNVEATSEEDKFFVRVGIADDLGIVYRDINGNFNLAGNAINMASRVMDIADKNQVMLTERAYSRLIHIQNKKHIEGEFEEHRYVRMKNLEPQSVWQYYDQGKPHLTRSERKPMPDLDQYLLSIQKEIGQINRKLDNRFTFLNSTDQIYDGVIGAINKAEHNIRIVRLGLRPAAPDKVLDAIALKVGGVVRYDIVIVLDPGKPIGGFEKNHDDLKKRLDLYKGAGARYKPWVLETNEPICFDLIIVDNAYVGIGFIHTSGVEDLQEAIMFENADVGRTLVEWFENVLRGNPGTQDFDVWKGMRSKQRATM